MQLHGLERIRLVDMNRQKVNRGVGILIAAAFCLFLIQSVFAIDVYEGVVFDMAGMNTTFIIGINFTFERIEVESNRLILNNQTISVSPSAGSVNVTINNFTITVLELNLSVDTASNITFEIGNFSADKNYNFYNSSGLQEIGGTNGSGYLNFTYEMGVGDSFEINTTKRLDGENCVYVPECQGGYCVNGFCSSSSTYCGDGYCDSGETCSSCSSDCGTCPGGGSPGGDGTLPPLETEPEDGGCEPGEKRCFGEYVQQCNEDGTIWIAIETCEYGCDHDLTECEPAPEGPERICNPGEKVCSDNELKECSVDGLEWVTTQVCYFGCDDVERKCSGMPEEVIQNMWIYGVAILVLVVVVVLVLLKKVFFKKPHEPPRLMPPPGYQIYLNLL